LLKGKPAPVRLPPSAPGMKVKETFLGTSGSHGTGEDVHEVVFSSRFFFFLSGDISPAMAQRSESLFRDLLLHVN